MSIDIIKTRDYENKNSVTDNENKVYLLYYIVLMSNY